MRKFSPKALSAACAGSLALVRQRAGLGVLLVLATAALASPVAVAAPSPTAALPGRIVAVGIPGASAISAVGTFHAGGPIHDVPRFAALTTPGQVLDPHRVLVASTSNFGAPLAIPDGPTGTILSIDLSGGEPLVVPPDFAASDGQASALGGRVQVFSAQSPAFTNGLNNPEAVTAELPSVGGPLAISLNNGFGRAWFGNRPQGSHGGGSETVVDADGLPLAGAPSALAGGVFVGAQTNRAPEQLIPGALGTSIVGTALLGASPDGSGRAVFAATSSDGSIVQVHVEKGVDGLAPAGTITPLPEAPLGQMPLRAGTLFNWVPNPIVYVADPLANTVVALELSDDGQVFQVEQTRRLNVPELHTPVDLAPAVSEVSNPKFASNTTLSGGSDLYVANRGDGTIVRLRQDGTVIAVRQVQVPGLGPLGPDRLNGIAISPDAQHLWVTVSGPLPGSSARGDLAVELPAFGAPNAASLDMARPSGDAKAESASLVARGSALFARTFTPDEGLGPLYNERSCLACHSVPEPGGMGADGLGTVVRFGRSSAAGFDPLLGQGGPVARAHAVAELGVACPLQPGLPAGANITSVRNAPALFGLGQLDAIPDAAIRAHATAYPDGVHGRPNVVRGPDGTERVGRFGWKSDTPTLAQFVGDAFRSELGITNPLAPVDLVPAPAGCSRAPGGSLDDDGTRVAAVTAFVAALDPPPAPVASDLRGEALFNELGCAECHTPSVTVSNHVLHPYTDLLLHDLGPTLDDGVDQAQASGRDWRTTPLWGLHLRTRFLHDGRARTVSTAIAAHGGEADAALQLFAQLDDEDHAALLRFLDSL